MARILIVTWDGGGNVPPMLGIAGELQRRGHEVRVLGHAQQREVVVSAGLKFLGYHHARPWSPKVAATGARFLLRFLFGVFTDPGPGKDVRDEIAREPVDLALVDSMILAGVCAAEADPLKPRASGLEHRHNSVVDFLALDIRPQVESCSITYTVGCADFFRTFSRPSTSLAAAIAPLRERRRAPMTRSCRRPRWSSATAGTRPRCAPSPTGYHCSSCRCTTSSISR